MPRSERIIFSSADKDESPRLRPEPPADLWDQLEALNAEASRKEQPRRPADSFTTKEYADKFGVSEPTAGRRIRKMIAGGDVQRHGASAQVFYTIIKKC